MLKHIEYWRKPHDNYGNDTNKIHEFFLSKPVINNKYPIHTSGYITFQSDCSQFNHRRQAYEFIIGVSWLTQRTLVFPVTYEWYLIDWGPIEISPPLDNSGVSNYDLFYDMDHLGEVINLMNLTDFLYKVQDDKELDLPKEYHINYDKKEISEEWERRRRLYFMRWQDDRSLDLSFAVPYGPVYNVLLWPSIKEVQESKFSKFGKQGEPILDAFIKDRTKREYFGGDLKLDKKAYIHFPSCVDIRDFEASNYRYIGMFHSFIYEFDSIRIFPGQVATAIGFADYELEMKYKKLIRDHSHFVPKVFEIASYMISYLGLFEYTSVHIRQSEFWWKSAVIPAEKSFHNIVKSMNETNGGEIVYLATDAYAEPDFFENIVGQYKEIKEIYRWRDFAYESGKLYDEFNKQYGHVLDVPKIRKLVPLIEMVVASGGKRFFGTRYSTYSAYITRLRGYIDAPDQGIYFHNGKHYMRYAKPYEYMIESKDMWLDIKDYCPKLDQSDILFNGGSLFESQKKMPTKKARNVKKIII